MLKAIRNYILNQRFNSKRSGSFVNWNETKSICVVARKDKFFAEANLSRYLKETNNEVDVILFHPDKNGSSDCFVSINKKDLDLFQFPKSEIVNKLKSKRYDIMIDCNFEGDHTAKAISVCVDAKCKVGHDAIRYADIFDVCINFGNNFSTDNYLKEVVNYLKMIKTNN